MSAAAWARPARWSSSRPSGVVSPGVAGAGAGEEESEQLSVRVCRAAAGHQGPSGNCGLRGGCALREEPSCGTEAEPGGGRAEGRCED